jgi:subtilisin family serine protease
MRLKKKRLPVRYTWPLVVLLTIPFVYNSCQGGLLGAKGFQSLQAVSCKAGLENGVVKKLEFNNSAPPDAFLYEKVRLKADLVSANAQTKASGPLTVKAGESLGLLLDNACLQENKERINDTVLSKAALNGNAMIRDLDRQVYEWILDRDYTDSEIESLADQESCVVGVSWNRTYKMQSTFSDPGFAQQTHLTAIHALEGYDRFYGNGSAGGMRLSGNAVILAVIDSGVDWQHPDLQGNMWSSANGIGVDITTVCTGCTTDYNPFDSSDIGHGTHVAGLMAAIANNGIGVVGAMPYRAKIMGIKVFKRESDGSLTTSSQYFYNAIRFAYLNGANVINLSLGAVGAGAATDTLAEAAVNEAVAHGTFVTVVIGNADNGQNGTLIDGTNYSSIPGQYATKAGVIGVGSFDAATGAKSYFSHYSTTYAEIGAPGAISGANGIYSTKPRSLNSYGTLAGTSQAAPLVSAAAGLTIGLIREAYGVAPTPAEVERLLEAGAIKSPQLTSYFKDGNRLDLAALVAKINADYPLTKNGSTTLSSLGCSR